MVFEWLAREGWIIVSWWLLVAAAGAAALPLCARLLGGLPDRGYTLARAAGLLLVGYVYWLLGSLGFLRNDTGGILLSWLIVLILGLLLYFSGQRLDLRAWWHENRSVVISAELLFALLFIGWITVRAYQNGLSATEKPMDLMFISGILRGQTFPPPDPWLSGYSISYYYFGYLIAAMLSLASGVSGPVGYNAFIALLFALTGLTVFGVVYNLVRSRRMTIPAYQETEPPRPNRRAAILSGLLGMVMVILMGNLQFLLIELPYQTRIAPEAYLSFMGNEERDVYPEREQARAAGVPDDQPVTLQPKPLDPNVWDGWWWFRASRTLRDYNVDGSTGTTPINEFPQFSFLLADSHPHVMALPFVALALGAALNLLLTWRSPTRSETLFYALIIGGLIFLNTWDGPVYLAVLVGMDVLRRYLRGHGRLFIPDWIGVAVFGLAVGVMAVIYYLPFLVSFRSQASGFVPNLLTPTLPQHYFIMFGAFILILAFYLIYEVRSATVRPNWVIGGAASVYILLGLIGFVLILVGLAAIVPQLRAGILQFVDQYGGWGAVLPVVASRRIQALLTTLLLLAAIWVIVARLFPRVNPLVDDDRPEVVVGYPVASGYALVLIGAGVGLTLIPEFFFLRDNFGVRINTIFKFYYQAWLLFSIASAWAVYAILSSSSKRRIGPVFRASFATMTTVLILVGLLYPIFGIRTRTQVEFAARTPDGGLTLDGGSTLIGGDDYASIQCFGEKVESGDVVVVEALGGAYNIPYPTGRVPGITGVPIVLGWRNHQGQWRGSTYNEVVGTREPDIETLYKDLRWDVVVPIVQRYGIDYIFYGFSERQTYGSVGEEKFMEALEPVCQRGNSVFYRVTDTALQTVAR